MQNRNVSWRLWPLLPALIIMLGFGSAALAAGEDASGHWAETALSKWHGLGFLQGDPDGGFRPDSSISRAEFVALVNRMQDYSITDDVSLYGDVAEVDWFYEDISRALAAGYINGTGENTMSPYDNITRQEAIVIIARIAGLGGVDYDEAVLTEARDAAQIADWARDLVGAALADGLVSGSDGSLNPQADITRAEAVVLMDRLYDRTSSGETVSGTSGGNTSGGGGIMLSSFIVTFESNGGSAVADGSVAVDGTVREPGAPGREDYAFGGWYKDAACTEPWNFSNDKATGDIAIYAKWVALQPVLSGLSQNNHASVRIARGGKVIYFDPYDIAADANDADVVFITHFHGDHFSPDDIAKVAKDTTKYVMPASIALANGADEVEAFKSGKDVTAVEQGQVYAVDGISFSTVAAYNTVAGRMGHPKGNDWVGYVVTMDGYRYYITGDTDATDELKAVQTDVIFAVAEMVGGPGEGNYNMTWSEAAEAVRSMAHKPLIAVPIHTWEGAGSYLTEETFVSAVEGGGSGITGVILRDGYK